MKEDFLMKYAQLNYIFRKISSTDDVTYPYNINERFHLHKKKNKNNKKQEQK